ncbi:MAG: glycoside hydrolase family 27 protein [Clostridia bacterium]|nr:glycoside hydrolase family 27 protein [Clostridia bacterium]
MDKNKLAKTPPMGWNSWDCYGAAVNEEQLLGNAEYIRDNLKDLGYSYVVCDIQWYEPTAHSNNYNSFADLCMDEFSRLIPAENRFPSSAGGKGFKPIADKIHAMGLKFGIHILRGIPRQAVHRNTAIKGCDKTARQIAHPFSVCSWNTDMYGVRSNASGAQEYYNSLFELYASWEVDFVKVDDIAVTEFSPWNPYSAKDEIEMIRKAIDSCGREMVLSLSPGPAPLDRAEHLSENANMWRLTGDFWDKWDRLRSMFERCEKWLPYVKEGCWPDCDMLPLGRISKNSSYEGDKDRYCAFSFDEQKTMFTLWCIFRSPLILGGELRENRPCDEEIIKNKELIDLNRFSTNNRQIIRNEKFVVWACVDKTGKDVVAIFNLCDEERSFDIALDFCGIEKGSSAFELWKKKEEKILENTLSVKVAPHGVWVARIER